MPISASAGPVVGGPQCDGALLPHRADVLSCPAVLPSPCILPLKGAVIWLQCVQDARHAAAQSSFSLWSSGATTRHSAVGWLQCVWHAYVQQLLSYPAMPESSRNLRRHGAVGSLEYVQHGHRRHCEEVGFCFGPLTMFPARARRPASSGCSMLTPATARRFVFASILGHSAPPHGFAVVPIRAAC